MLSKNICFKAIAIMLLGMLIGCDDFKFGNKFLEKPLSDSKDLNTVFSQKLLADQVLAEAYHSLPDFLPGSSWWSSLESLTDIGDDTKPGGNDYYKGQVTNSSSENSFPYSISGGTAKGVNPIYGIRQCYVYLENVDRVPDMTADEKKLRKAEAKAIIAFHYAQMLRYFGGTPWIDHAYGPNEEYRFERMTVAQQAKKIYELADEAAKILPWNVAAEDDGRMTAASMLGLKVRVALFVASPLFNNDKPYHSGEAANKLLTWLGEYDEERWQDVVDFGHDFIRRNKENGTHYQLVNTGNPRDDFAAAYFNRFNGEVLIGSRRFTTYNPNSYAFSQVRFGVCEGNVNFHDMFPMKDGSAFDWNNPDHAATPFFDEKGERTRDWRLYETFVVNQDRYSGRKAEVYIGGREGPGAKAPFSNRGRNCLAMRKFGRDWNKEVKGKYYQCPLLRLPEIYLSMAEAMNALNMANQKDEFGNDAYDYLNMTRNRVETPAITSAQVPQGDALKEAILTERALEFGFEEVRYFDIVRNKRVDLFQTPSRKLIIKKVGKKFTHEISTKVSNPKRMFVQEQFWSTKYFLLPFQAAEVNKGYGLIQNPGWE